MSQPVIVCGSMAFDTIMVFEGYFKDHIVAEHIRSLSVSFLVPSMRREYGGCAGNVAYGMALLGGQPVPVATVGTDASDYLQRLQSLGIDSRWVKVVPETFTAQAYITNDLADSQITAFHPGAMAHSASNDLTDAPGVLAIVAPDAKEGMLAHAQRLRARGTPFIFDLGQALPLFNGDDLREMIALASVVTLNDYEARVVQERVGESYEEIAARLEALIVTHGADGSTLWTGGERFDVPAVKPTAVVDPTGCGDAYRAGLLYGRASGWSWLDSARLASVMGSLKIAQRGPQTYAPTRAEIDAVLQQAFGLSLPQEA